MFVEADVYHEEQIEVLINTSVKEFERIDTVLAAAVVFKAGYVSGATSEGPVESDDDQPISRSVKAWHKVLQINLTGVILTDRLAGRIMIDQGTGSTIVNIA